MTTGENREARQPHYDEDHDKLTGLIAEFREYRKAMEERLMKLNELREQVLSDRSSFVRADIYNSYNDATLARVAKLENWQARMYGAIAVAMVAAGIVGAVLEHAFK